MTNFIYTIFVLLFSLGQLGRISLSNSQINFYFYEVFLIFCLVGFFLKYKIKPLPEFFKREKIIKYFFIWLVTTFLVRIPDFSFNQNLISGLYLLRLLFYPVFFIYLKKIKLDIKYINLLSVLIIISSFIQYFFYPDLRNLIYQGWDPHLNRMFGIYFDTSIAASIYSILFLFFLRKKNYLFSILFLICVVLTFSRSAYLVLLLTLIITYAFSKNLKNIFIFIAVFLFIFAVAPKNFGNGVELTRIFTVNSRIADYKTAFSAAIKSPIIGYGYNRIKFIKSSQSDGLATYPSHSNSAYSSSDLTILVTTGIIGLILFLASLSRLFFVKDAPIAILVFASLVSFTDNIILHPFVMMLLGVTILLSDR
ncbi:MAG: hypothetical protein UR22_C0037G0005 [Parcubacteria group bacterium GW2011_GWC2_32_10]|nr:MAG: hypothetical protein UR22_C0037G0005 [Parcubacteria group bacterium GW2011_GWC2_32_10]